MNVPNPFTMTDFRGGRVAKSAVAPALVPQNSVANSLNVDFSELIGSAIVRKGKQALQTLVYPFTTGQNFVSATDDSTLVYDVNWYAQTFTQAATQTLVGVKLKLKRTGSPGLLTLQLRTTSGGSPTAVVLGTSVLSGTDVPTTAGGTIITFIFSPGVTLANGVKYALVLNAASGDIGNNVIWYANLAGGYGNGQYLSSGDSGGSWSAQAYDFYFTILVNDTTSSYNRAPLGNYAVMIASAPKSVVVYNTPASSTGVIYYYNGSSWVVSTAQNLSATALNRFAVLNGSIFRANGANAMTSSSDGGLTWVTTNCITTDNVIPSLLVLTQNRMLASGYSAFPSRIYFSSIVDSNANPFIAWSTDPSTGDWLDVNPDDGGVVTGFSKTSTLTLVFKNNGLYRLNAISITLDSENIFNVGAPSQEAITSCLGITYFYSGNGIYSTDGTFPTLISRIGVQDYIDGIQDASQVYAGTDGFNVYFSIGAVTLQLGPENFRTISNVVLKFSPRDNNWQVFTYNKRLGQFANFNTANNASLQSAQYNGALATVNYTSAAADDGVAIPYELETQELEMGNRAHTKIISDQIAVFTQFGTNGNFEIKANDGDFASCNLELQERINIGANNNFAGNFFTFKWSGETLGTNAARPILQGVHLPKVTDQGVVASTN